MEGKQALSPAVINQTIVRRLLEELFDDYVYDGSGTLNSPDALLQLTVSVWTELCANERIPCPMDQIKATTSSKAEESDNLDHKGYACWFLKAFNLEGTVCAV